MIKLKRYLKYLIHNRELISNTCKSNLQKGGKNKRSTHIDLIK